MGVTLHVSVWVEMSLCGGGEFFSPVTLHVSVWVEICNFLLREVFRQSRSTWACELKSNFATILFIQCGHAPRERVSWNNTSRIVTIDILCHAPRERVSWNLLYSQLSFLPKCHAPRERVSWNALCVYPVSNNFSHAPRERVSWNEYSDSKGKTEKGHAPRERVSWNPVIATKSCIFDVTLHVSVWVEISMLKC